MFHEAVGLTGITPDQAGRYGERRAIFSVKHQFGIPIRYIGVGERIEDLRPLYSGRFY
ncbi:hypothetical protein KCP76_08115 [Salmonella enterica subsp. enterica serovar Weltevreden]|nr:hypothetical protein KCP76_08115 [Salmonella enterica subsp. enterica serovar Weltevreden]